MIIDVVSLTLAITLIAALAQPFLSIQLSVPSPGGSWVCKNVSDLKHSAYIPPLLNASNEEKIVAVVCETTSMGLLGKRVLTVNAVKVEGRVTTSRGINIVVDEELTPLTHIDLTNIIYLIMPLFFAIALATTGTTLGKRIMRLKLHNQSGQPLSIARYVGREYLRYLPWIIPAAIGLLASPLVFNPSDIELLISKLDDFQFVANILLATGVATVIIVVVYLVSLLRWRGHMFYDKITGFEVRYNKSRGKSAPK